jgi:ABC-type transport system substrate-binding protein
LANPSRQLDHRHTTTSSKYGGILNFATNAVPGTPIGWMQETIGGSTVTMQLVMDFLLHERVDGTLDPNLAESYEVNPDPKAPSVTFKLRRGVKYSDGSDFSTQLLSEPGNHRQRTPNASQAILGVLRRNR